jgi:hypothetical protein
MLINEQILIGTSMVGGEVVLAAARVPGRGSANMPRGFADGNTAAGAMRRILMSIWAIAGTDGR